MSRKRELSDRIRRSANEIQNHVIDEYVAGRLTRRGFLRGATVVGLSATSAGFLAACSGGQPSAGGTPGSGAPGGTIKAGALATPGQLDPTTLATGAALCLMTQTCEYLSLSNGQPELQPRLAEKWTSNDDATKWDFTIRQGVTFHDGTPLTARDVAATFNRLADPAVASGSLGIFTGLLSKGAVTAPDDRTVTFELEKPSGAFSWLISSDNFNAMILPATYEGDWEKTWPGTGPFKIDQYVPGQLATFTRNESYWG